MQTNMSPMFDNLIRSATIARTLKFGRPYSEVILDSIVWQIPLMSPSTVDSDVPFKRNKH